MKQIKSFISLAFIGGMLVILPLALFAFVLSWIFGTFSKIIAPVSNPISHTFGLSAISSDALVLVIFLALCTIVGVLVRTALGQFIHHAFDRLLVRIAPGYKTIKMMVQQLLGSEKSVGPFNGEVVLARIFGIGNPTAMTGIVTSHLANGWVTVYVPTAPIPTSGLTYHLPLEAVVFLPEVSVEEAMRTIIACGAGSADILTEVHLKHSGAKKT